MKKKKYIILFLLLFISMGFAYLSTNLNITGVSLIKGNSWDVHFENVKVNNQSVALSEGDSAPTISVDGLTINFEVSLNEPGDFYKFTADIVNEGTIDAMVDSLNVEGLSSYSSFIGYRVTYDYGREINQYDILRAGETKHIIVYVEYKEDIDKDDLKATDSEINFNVTLNYKQADSNAQDISEIKQFKIQGRNVLFTFNFIEGSTWEEWIDNPECNTKSATKTGNGSINLEDGWMNQDLQEEIIEGNTYYLGWAECVSPDSNIIINLNEDTKQAKDIRKNDTIVYHDFKTNTEKEGKVDNIFIHKKADSFVKYYFDDNTYLDVTDYHPIYTTTGWKSYTNRNGYKTPLVGDSVKTLNGFKELIKIESYTGEEDYYDFVIIDGDKKINNYYANNVLVEGSY